MKRINLLVTITAMAVLLGACDSTTDNRAVNMTANTNVNAARAIQTVPNVDDLFTMDKKANEAWIKGDSNYFESFMSDKFVSFEMGQRMDRSEMLKMVAENKCDVRTWSLEDQQMAMIDADTYVISYKGTWDGSCTGPDGKAMKLPSPVRAASVYVRNGEMWQGAFHGENMIIDPKSPPAPPAKAEPAKNEAKKDDKEEVAAPAKSFADANTGALVKLHTAGWEAFKAKDAKKFDEMLSANFSMVDPLGGWLSGKANVVKQWTQTMKCEGITKVGVTDGFASALSPTVEVLAVKGTADGKCDGQKNGPLNQAAVYVKEGDAWKLAFMFESAAM